MGLELNAKKTEVMTFNINEKAKITTKNGTMLAVKESWILHQLDRKGHPDTEGSCMENTPRPQEYLALCYAMQSSWPRWNSSCYMVQRHGRLLQCKKLGSMAATQVCSGECSTLHGGIGSGMGSSMEISLESLQRPGREDFEWQDTMSDTLNWLQPSSFCGNRRRDELHEAASL